MRQVVLRGRKGIRPKSVRGVGKTRDNRFLRVVLLTATCIDEAQDVCFMSMPSFVKPEAFRARVRVLGRAV